jgi:hypothetical protein
MTTNDKAKLTEASRIFLTQAAELFDLHEQEITELLDESDSKKVKIGFALDVNLADVPASAVTTISFSKVVKDRRSSDLADPDQPTLPGVEFSLHVMPPDESSPGGEPGIEPGSTETAGEPTSPPEPEAPRKRGRPRKITIGA